MGSHITLPINVISLLFSSKGHKHFVVLDFCMQYVTLQLPLNTFNFCFHLLGLHEFYG